MIDTSFCRSNILVNRAKSALAFAGTEDIRVIIDAPGFIGSETGENIPSFHHKDLAL